MAGVIKFLAAPKKLLKLNKVLMQFSASFYSRILLSVNYY